MSEKAGSSVTNFAMNISYLTLLFVLNALFHGPFGTSTGGLSLGDAFIWNQLIHNGSLNFLGLGSI